MLVQSLVGCTLGQLSVFGDIAVAFFCYLKNCSKAILIAAPKVKLFSFA